VNDVATVRIADGELLAAMERGLDEGARVILLDATAPVDSLESFTPGELARLTLFELPVVCAFEGPLRGAATAVALAADIRVCGEGASLRGRLASDSRARTLADEGTALALFLGRDEIGTAALLDAGLVSEVAPSGRALAAGQRVAEVIASRGPIGTRLGKEAIWRGLAQPLEQALRFETDLTLLLQTTKDRAEGVRAFLEKRTPNFTGE
jgi:enoyl-CoA hydratase/carnithine racemase